MMDDDDEETDDAGDSAKEEDWSETTAPVEQAESVSAKRQATARMSAV